jgi:hypothetical protein
MMKIMLSVQYVDGSGAGVEASVPDFIAFERKYDRPVASFANDPRIEYMCFLTWHALTRTKGETAEFDDWLSKVAELTIGDEEEIAPLESNQPTGT